MKTTLLALGAVLAPLCASQAHAREVQTKSMTTFCRSIADMDQWTRYIMAGDDVAAQGFYEAKNLEHTPGRGSSCWQEPAGYYTVSDTSPGTVGPLECLRPSGIITCAWTIGVSHMPYNK